MLKRIIAGVAVAVMLAGSAAAGPVEDGAAAYESGDYAKAVKMFRLAADQGNAAAQANLGVMYAKGQGVPQDYSEAVKWYRLAADQGDAIAQFNLGVMYAKGQGVPQDYSEAVKWYRLAADQGYATAQFNLGIMYAKGQGVPQDYSEAVKWYRLAADQGHADGPVQPRHHVRQGPRRPAGLLRGCEMVSPRCRPGRCRAPRATSASCTPRAKASRRTTCSRICGSTFPLRRATKMRLKIGISQPVR